MESLEKRMNNFEIKLDQSAITITSTQSTITTTQANKESLVEEPNFSPESSDLYCFNENWRLVQQHADGSKKIYRDWKDVEAAVGNKSNVFLARLEKLYRLASLKPEDILVKTKNYDNARRNIPKISIEDEVYNDVYDLNEY
ncbi:uncharacterized protein LOC135961898 [Calliphora vicina]|uniref:uncharacterized protein LOC135961898 n=1 Tax=Calliphora vicina TaxID=7373 RepID=UPI00325B0B7C